MTSPLDTRFVDNASPYPHKTVCTGDEVLALAKLGGACTHERLTKGLDDLPRSIAWCVDCGALQVDRGAWEYPRVTQTLIAWHAKATEKGPSSP